MTLRSAVLALAFLAAACQPIPHPFADKSDLPPIEALRPADSAGILVLPPGGALARQAGAVAAALATSLQAADVPASTDSGNRDSFRLESEGDDEDVAPGQERLVLRWTLKDAAGGEVGTGIAQALGKAPAAKALAADAAPAIAALARGDAPPSPKDIGATVAMAGVSGAPGDGGTSLARAIGTALGRAGVEVGAAGAKAEFDLICRVAVTPVKDGKQQVSVVWLLASPAGRKLGEVSQQNEVPAGSLDGAWGDIAYAVAGAAAPGIAQLVERAKVAPQGG